MNPSDAYRLVLDELSKVFEDMAAKRLKPAMVARHLQRMRKDSGTTLDKPVSSLGLPRRLHRACVRLDIRTLRDFKEHSADEFLDVRSFGEVSLLELRRILAEFGVKLPGE